MQTFGWFAVDLAKQQRAQVPTRFAHVLRHGFDAGAHVFEGGRGLFGKYGRVATRGHAAVVQSRQRGHRDNLTNADMTVGRIVGAIPRLQKISDVFGRCFKRHFIGDFKSDASLARGGQETIPQMLSKSVARVGHDHQNVTAPLFYQTLNSISRESLVVEINPGVGCGEFRTAMGDERQIGLVQQTHTIIKGFRPGENHSVSQIVSDDIANRIEPIRAIELGRHADREIRTAKRFDDSTEKFVGKSDEFVLEVQQNADDFGAARAQALRGTIRYISKLFGSFRDSFARFGSDSRVIFQCARDCGHGKTGFFGNGPKGWSFASALVCHGVSGPVFSRLGI